MRVTYINLSGYQFLPLGDLENFQKTLRQHCLALGLKGTILLSPEGINLFICAIKPAVDQFVALLKQWLPPVDFKESVSATIPFNHMRVKIKKEIITFGVKGIDPATSPAPTVSATTFHHWLNQGKEMIVLDTRNTYEVEMGKFDQAIHLNIPHFRHFPEALQQLPAHYRQQPVVTYCTGGIRCEKAAPYLSTQGFQEVYQLQGGILKYLEECGGAHFSGRCFVFDNRIALNTDLSPMTDR